MVYCKPCSNAQSRKNFRISKSSKRGHAKQIFDKRKRLAKLRGIPFTIEFDEVFKLAGDKCPVFNTPLSWCELGGKPKANTPSLDKMIPELGYVPGNVFWVSYRANSIKTNATMEEISMVLKYMKSAQKYLKKYSCNSVKK